MDYWPFGVYIDATGDLHSGSANMGKYSEPFHEGDVLDVYYAGGNLSFGLNDEKYGKEYKVRAATYHCCVSMKFSSTMKSIPW